MQAIRQKSDNLVMYVGANLTAEEITNLGDGWCDPRVTPALAEVVTIVSLPAGFLPDCWTYNGTWAIVPGKESQVDAQTGLINPLNALVPTGLTFSNVIERTGPFNAVSISVRLSWDNMGSTIREYLAAYRTSSESDWHNVSPTADVFSLIRNLSSGTYYFRARSISIEGVFSEWGSIGPVTVEMALAAGGPSITGLELWDQGTNYAFTGKDPRFKWDVSSAIYDPSSGDVIDQTGMHTSYHVQVLTPANVVLRDFYTTDNFFTYSFEENFFDNAGTPLRAFKVRVWDVFLTTQSTSPAEISVTNAQQAILTGVAITELMDGFEVSFNMPTDVDFQGVKLWGTGLSTVVVGRVSTITAVCPVGSYTAYIAAFDSFGQDALTAVAINPTVTGTVPYSSIDGAPDIGSIYNNDVATVLGFNPTLSDWTGTVPAGFSYAGSLPLKETTIKQTGANAIKFIAAGALNHFVYKQINFNTNPLPLGTVVNFKARIYLGEVTTGLPAARLILWTNASFTTYESVWAEPQNILGVWQNVSTLHRLAEGARIYGIRLDYFASWGGLPSGLFTGTVYYDGMTLDFLDKDLDNANIDLASLGYTGDLDATNGAIWDENIDGQPKVNLNYFSETWESANALDDWDFKTKDDPNVEISIVTDGGVAGGKFLRIGNNAGNDEVWMVSKRAIPFDPTKLYRSQIRIKDNDGTTSGPIFYAGFSGLAADGTTIITSQNVSSTELANSHYHTVLSVRAPNTWTTYKGYTKGNALTVGYNGVGLLSAPATMAALVRYIRPMIIVNYLNLAGITDIDSFTVEAIPEGTSAINDDANLGETAIWDSVSDPSGTKPADNADVTDYDTIYETAQGFVDALNIGGRNLFPNTDLTTVFTQSNPATFVDTVRITTPLLTELEYTVSFFAVSTNATQTMNCFFYTPNTTISAVSSTGHTSTGSDGYASIIATNVKKRYWVTWKQSSADSTKVVIIGRITGLTSNISISGIKFEVGNKATDWSPAPEDITLQFTNIASDTVFDQSEKNRVKVQIGEFEQEKIKLAAAATALGITDTITGAYTTLYNQLVAYGLNTAGNTTIVAATFKGYFTTYSLVRETLRKAISDKAATTANWSGVADNDGNKPANNATVGATVGQDLIGLNTDTTNYVLNGDLTTASPLYWIGSASRDTAKYFSGGASLKVVSSASGGANVDVYNGKPDGSTLQYIPVEPGQTIYMDARIWTDVAAAGVQIGFKGYSASLVAVNSYVCGVTTATGSWQLIRGTYVVPAGVYFIVPWIRGVAAGTGGNNWIDSIRLYKFVPGADNTEDALNTNPITLTDGGLILDSLAEIKSENFISGVSGFKIDGQGDIEIFNAKLRGLLSSVSGDTFFDLENNKIVIEGSDGSKSELSNAGLNFFYPNSAVPYAYVKRVVSGIVANQEMVTFSPPFETIPHILMSAEVMPTFYTEYSNYNQFIKMEARYLSETGFAPTLKFLRAPFGPYLAYDFETTLDSIFEGVVSLHSNTPLNDTAKLECTVIVNRLGSVTMNGTEVTGAYRTASFTRYSLNTYVIKRFDITMRVRKAGTLTWLDAVSYNTDSMSWDSVDIQSGYNGAIFPVTLELTNLNPDDYDVEVYISNITTSNIPNTPGRILEFEEFVDCGTFFFNTFPFGFSWQYDTAVDYFFGIRHITTTHETGTIRKSKWNNVYLEWGIDEPTIFPTADMLDYCRSHVYLDNTDGYWYVSSYTIDSTWQKLSVLDGSVNYRLWRISRHAPADIDIKTPVQMAALLQTPSVRVKKLTRYSASSDTPPSTNIQFIAIEGV